MKIGEVPHNLIHWRHIPKVEHRGETGTSFQQQKEIGNYRFRLIEYSRNFRSDHWCKKGHMIYVVRGVIDLEFKNGDEYQLGETDCFILGNNKENPHITSCDMGAKILVID